MKAKKSNEKSKSINYTEVIFRSQKRVDMCKTYFLPTYFFFFSNKLRNIKKDHLIIMTKILIYYSKPPSFGEHFSSLWYWIHFRMIQNKIPISSLKNSPELYITGVTLHLLRCSLISHRLYNKVGTTHAWPPLHLCISGLITENIGHETPLSRMDCTLYWPSG